MLMLYLALSSLVWVQFVRNQQALCDDFDDLQNSVVGDSDVVTLTQAYNALSLSIKDIYLDPIKDSFVIISKPRWI